MAVVSFPLIVMPTTALLSGSPVLAEVTMPESQPLVEVRRVVTDTELVQSETLPFVSRVRTWYLYRVLATSPESAKLVVVAAPTTTPSRITS